MLFPLFLPALTPLAYPVRIGTMAFTCIDAGMDQVYHELGVFAHVVPQFRTIEVNFGMFCSDLFHALMYPGGSSAVVSFFGHFVVLFRFLSSLALLYSG